MHGIFSFHVGMRVRLKRNISLRSGLVQEAEGTVVDVVLSDDTSAEVRSAWAAQAGFEEIVADEVPSGIWLLMDEFLQNPNLELSTKLLLDPGGGHLDNDSGLRVLTPEEQDCARRLFFLERCTSFPFTVEVLKNKYKITRTQLPLTHGRVRTCQASQGRTFEGGVIVDMTRMKKTDEESWWLNMYVMLSRGRSLKQILLFNAPVAKSEWDALQPPKDLVDALRRLENLAQATQKKRSA